MNENPIVGLVCGVTPAHVMIVPGSMYVLTVPVAFRTEKLGESRSEAKPPHPASAGPWNACAVQSQRAPLLAAAPSLAPSQPSSLTPPAAR